MKRLSAPCGPASTRATTRRSTFQFFGGVEEVAITADLISLTADPSHGGILGEIADPVQQHCVAGEAKDVADTLALAPRHRLGPAVVAVAAHQNLDRRPA